MRMCSHVYCVIFTFHVSGINSTNSRKSRCEIDVLKFPIIVCERAHREVMNRLKICHGLRIQIFYKLHFAAAFTTHLNRNILH